MKLIDVFRNLYESPMNIPDIDWHDLNIDEKNAKLYKDLIRKKYQRKIKILQLTDYAVVYQYKTEYFCLDSNAKRVTYYMKYQVGNNGVLYNYVWQSLVWIDPKYHYDYLDKIPAKIFFEYLLPKYHTIITDSEQTWYGKRFWQYRIIDALKKGLNVYFFDFDTKKLKQLHVYDELSNYQAEYDIWGETNIHKMKRMVITDRTYPERE